MAKKQSMAQKIAYDKGFAEGVEACRQYVLKYAAEAFIDNDTDRAEALRDMAECLTTFRIQKKES